MSYISGVGNYYSNSFIYRNYLRTGAGYGNKAPAVSAGKPSGYVNAAAASYLSGIQEGAKALSGALSALTSSSAYNKTAAASSDTGSLTVQSSGAQSGKFKESQIEITQIAAGQLNKGGALASNGLYSGQTGAQRFEIEADGKKTMLRVDIKPGDTNKGVQQKMADAINSAKLGLTAKVTEDSAAKTASLVIESNASGNNSKSGFAIRDYGKSSIVSNLGAASVERTGQDAVYKVDGVQRTSSSNNIDLGDGVKATLVNSTGKPITVAVAEDSQYAAGKFKDIINSYNDLLSASGTGGSSRLYDRLTEAAKSYLPSLEKLGVSMSEDGSLSVDSEKLGEAAQSGKLKKAFQSSGNSAYGFAGRLSGIARSVQNNPTAYVGRKSQSWAIEDPSSLTRQDLQNLNDYTNFNMAKYAGYMNTYNAVGALMNLFV